MGGRGSNNVSRLLTGPNRTTQWKRETVTIGSADYTGQSNGKYVVYKTPGGRYRIYNKKKRSDVMQSGGTDLTFNKLSDAKQYASKLK